MEGRKEGRKEEMYEQPRTKTPVGNDTAESTGVSFLDRVPFHGRLYLKLYLSATCLYMTNSRTVKLVCLGTDKKSPLCLSFLQIVGHFLSRRYLLGGSRQSPA